MPTPYPEWPLKFLAWFCPDYLLEEIEGDLIERFYYDQNIYNNSKARRRFIWNTLRFCRPGILKRNTVDSKFGLLVMFNSNLRIATRVILRNKVVSAFSISGLMLGLAGALLMGLSINHEFSYDNFHEDIDRIYKAYNMEEVNGEISTWDYTPRVLAPTLKSDYPFIEQAASYASWGDDYLFTVGDKKIINGTGIYTDADFLKMFSFEFLSGSKESALPNPNAIVLTESFARMLFGTEQVQGKTVTISAEGASFDFIVSAVLKDLPSNTDFQFDYILGFRFLENIFGADEGWSNNSVRTFVKLAENVTLEEANEQIRDVARVHTKNESEKDMMIYPVERMHLRGQFENGVEAGGRIEIMRILMLLVVSLVLIASINFINISTARAQKRSREIGVRKAIGAGRGALVVQFLFESILMVLVAGMGALLLATYLLPAFNSMVNKDLSIPWGDPVFWLIITGSLIFTGILSGAYPAAYLSSLMPVESLGGSGSSKGGKAFIRKSLVVIQFGFAVQLIFSTLVIQNQIEYIQTRQTGYDRENLIFHPLTDPIDKSFDAYRNELLKSGYVQSITRSSAPMTEQWSSTLDMQWEGKEEDEKLLIERFHAGDNILETIGIELKEGRQMDITKFAADSASIMINEAAAKAMRFEDPIGQQIIDNDKSWTVVGVVKDFVFYDPQGDIPPMIIYYATSAWFNGVHIRLNPDKPTEASLQAVGTVFTSIDPDYPFDYTFIDNEYNAKFSGIKQTMLISTVFGIVIVVIACAGLFALSLYLINNKLKEIGVRKVFGSSTGNIVKILCWNILKPILIAIVLFSPIAWLAMDWWLGSYAYSIDLNAGYLFGASLILIVIAMVTIIFQTTKAAATNPIKVLRSE